MISDDVGLFPESTECSDLLRIFGRPNPSGALLVVEHAFITSHAMATSPVLPTTIGLGRTPMQLCRIATAAALATSALRETTARSFPLASCAIAGTQRSPSCADHSHRHRPPARRLLTTATQMTAIDASSSAGDAASARFASSTSAPEGIGAGQPRVHVYPFGTCPHRLIEESQERCSDGTDVKTYARAKVVHFVRHAQGTHNVNCEYRDLLHLDARLTEKGRDQCRALADRILSTAASSSEGGESRDAALRSLLHGADLVVASPLTRCLQTAHLSVVEPLQGTGKRPCLSSRTNM